MTTVSQPHPASHTIAALFRHDDDTVLAWQCACAEAAEALRTGEEAHDARLHKALLLAQDGAVALDAHGSALVQSGTTRYRVETDGTCLCEDAAYRHVTCKHALAAQIAARAQGVCVTHGAAEAAAAPQAQGWKPTPKTAARWDVHEAPASACVKFRVGALEMTYTFRGQTDAEVVPRVRDTLPVVQALLVACAERADQWREATEARAEAVRAAAAAPVPSTPAPSELHALLQETLRAMQAKVQTRVEAHLPANGHAPSAPEPDDQASGFCSLHQAAMALHSDPSTGDTWRSHYDEDTGRYCKGQRPSRRSRR